MGLPGCPGNWGEFGKQGGDMLDGGGILRELTVDLEGPGGLPTCPLLLRGDICCLLFGLEELVLAFRVGMPG